MAWKKQAFVDIHIAEIAFVSSVETVTLITAYLVQANSTIFTWIEVANGVCHCTFIHIGLALVANPASHTVTDIVVECVGAVAAVLARGSKLSHWQYAVIYHCITLRAFPTSPSAVACLGVHSIDASSIVLAVCQSFRFKAFVKIVRAKDPLVARVADASVIVSKCTITCPKITFVRRVVHITPVNLEFAKFTFKPKITWANKDISRG